MNDLKLFNSDQFGQVRAVNQNGEMLFTATNVTKCLGIELTKNSSENEIKRYFNAILDLSKSDNEFPINLDEVWLLVYSRRDKAIARLKADFLEGVDFQSIPQGVDGSKFTKTDYFLSLSCMEYFIARKVRPVFEVYRQVFHHATNKGLSHPVDPSYQIEDPITRAQRWIEEHQEKQLLESKNEHLQELNGQLAEENNQLAEENLTQKPKVEFAECIMQSPDCISVGEMANILKQNKLFNKGQNALFEWLRYNGYLLCKGIRYNLPTQKSINNGVMRMAERPSITNGGVIINRRAVVTPYGQQYFIKLFRERKTDKTTLATLFE